MYASCFDSGWKFGKTTSMFAVFGVSAIIHEWVV
jgi:hypothetical protein